MDIEPRIALAFAIMAVVVVTAIPLSIRQIRRRRADRLRRRGIKSYNRSSAR